MKLFRPRPIVIFVWFTLIALPMYAQTSGALDTTFGHNGEVLFQPLLPNGGTPVHRNSVLQTDGKIVTLLQYGSGVQNVLARLNPDGSLDSSFGTGGYVYMSWGGTGSGFAFEMTKQIVSDEERFVVAGWAPCGKSTCLRVERYTSSGAFDTSFGTAGVTTNATEYPNAMAVQPADQKVVMVDRHGAVMRLLANGLIDSGFGTNGISTVSGIGLVGGIAVTSSSRILVCGSYSKGKTSDFAIARLNVNGSLDDGGRYDSTPGDAFGTGGRATTDFGGYGENAYSMVIDSAGRILASGQAVMGGSTYSYANAVLVRYSANGQIDTSFGAGGKTWLDIGGRQDIFTSLALQSDGKIVATGEGRYAGTPPADILTARYNTDGTIDGSFGAGGWVMQDVFGLYDQAQSILVQSDPGCGGCEKIIVVGAGGTSSTTFQAVALRYFP